jgi:hypothetical protein
MSGSTSEELLPLNTSILLTVTGVSKCVEIEAHAALTLLPSAYAGIGISLAFDLPVHVKACGLGSLGLSEIVEVNVWGPGLEFSDPMLAKGLEAIGFEAYGSEHLSIRNIRERIGEEGFESVLASVEGSLAVTPVLVKPLENLVNTVAVVVKLKKPIEDATFRVVDILGLTSYSLYKSVIDADKLLEELHEIARVILPAQMFNEICKGYACAVDYTGRFVVSIHDMDDDELGKIAYEASKYGSVVVADVIVPPI